MNARRGLAIVLVLFGLALASAAAGGLIGYRLGRQSMADRADPVAWHQRAIRRFDEVVHPTPEQGARVSAHLDAALAELRTIRGEAVQRTTAVIDRLVAQVEAELTPEQRTAFQQLKPKREDVTLDTLNADHER